ncbi:hypothetical protein H310_09559 [Aphanomyces invadans]|uniref:Uncharacterized protein n=1 Tax=Aphanomyces invadans TaxID=157072 RepID=A0A024TWC4_9STRA|nr:hypothetical protein H310_09559 [Aphanomyces invadans]ETV97672.1 hypothetical protein H310_09559 [Aphanomyces invadans]|eukprot:XP_008873881.1 hypothetical protein H310_09559 [Aphanomyces invadans]
MACENFGRVVDGKKEKHMLLDDIVTLYDDVKIELQKIEEQKRSQGQDKKDKVEQGGQMVREMAMKTMKRRRDVEGDDPKRPAHENRRNSLAAANLVESELE